MRNKLVEREEKEEEREDIWREKLFGVKGSEEWKERS